MKKSVYFVIILLFGSELRGQAATTRGWAAGQGPKAPCLVVLGSRPAISPKRAEWQALCRTDGLLDLRASVRFIDETTLKGREIGHEFRATHRLLAPEEGPFLWALLNSRAVMVASGRGLPTEEDLLQALAASGEVSPVAQLRSFLRSRPEHAEARRDYLFALRPRLLFRLQEHPADPGMDLPPETDEQVWGDLSRALDPFLASEDWVLLDMSLDRLLPGGIPERQSPLMKALYRKHVPRLLEAVRRLPEFDAGWLNLIRVDQALEANALVPTLKGLSLFGHPGGGGRGFNFLPVSRGIIAEARRSGNWKNAVPLLHMLWEEVARPWLKSAITTGVGWDHRAPTTEEIRQIDLEERSQTWTLLLAPLIEGMVRAGLEGEIPNLLGTLDASWQPLELSSKLTELAESLERRDLASRWRLQVQGLPDPGRSHGATGQEFRLIHQDQDLPAGDRAFIRAFRQEGIGVSMQRVESGRTGLGWPERTPRWALLDASSKVVLEGTALPTPGALIQAFRETHVRTWTEDAERFNQSHPGHLTSLAYLAGVRQGQAHAYWEARLPGRPSVEVPAPEMGDRERTCWRSYFQALEAMLEDPLGTHPGLLQMAAPYALVIPGGGADEPGSFPPEAKPRREPSPQTLPDNLGVKALAARLLPRIESALVHRPSDAALWESWMALGSVLDRSPADLVRSIDPSPVAGAGAWPDGRVLLRLCQDQRRRERWGEIVDMLMPVWTLEQGRRSRDGAGAQGASPGAWNGRLGHLLIEACLHLGTLTEAEKVIQASDSKDTPLDGVVDLQSLAGSLGHGAWAARWLTR